MNDLSIIGVIESQTLTIVGVIESKEINIIGEIIGAGPAGETGLQGIQGITGETGITGISAYQEWLNLENVGTEQIFLDTLKGIQGDIGLTGDIGPTGDAGLQGIQGESFNVDVFDTLANKYLYDTEIEGFTYLATDTGDIYIKKSDTSGDWSLPIPFEGPKGDTGIQGEQGIQGETGLKGDQGIQGVQGIIGPNGLVTYTWIKYATSSTGAGISDLPAGMTYIGIATNKLTTTESTITTDYSWSLIKGDTGAQGIQGVIGNTGLKGDIGFTGDTGLQGEIGLSAYQVWISLGNVGTEEEYLIAITGAQGIPGLDGEGAGDMLKTVYDSTNNGIVDNAEKLGGKLPAEFVLSSEKGVAGGVALYDTLNTHIINDTVYTLPSTLPATMIVESVDHNFLLDAERTKLSGVAVDANNYVHPVNHPPSIITQDASNRFSTDAEKTTWNAKQPALGFTAVPDTRTVNTKPLSTDIVLTPDNLDDVATAHKFVSAGDITKLGNLSNTNSGDETTTTIKSKLSITTLSGSNTGDQTIPTTLPASSASSLVITTGLGFTPATAAQGAKADAALPSASYTAADVLAKLKTVDGAGSDLDADLLDGIASTGFATAAQGGKADTALQNAALFATAAQGTLATNALPQTGGTLTGILTAQSNISYTVAQMHNIILSTADADLASMTDGDLWVKYV